jgi:hypothetical protein
MTEFRGPHSVWMAWHHEISSEIKPSSVILFICLFRPFFSSSYISFLSCLLFHPFWSFVLRTFVYIFRCLSFLLTFFPCFFPPFLYFRLIFRYFQRSFYVSFITIKYFILLLHFHHVSVLWYVLFIINFETFTYGAGLLVWRIGPFYRETRTDIKARTGDSNQRRENPMSYRIAVIRSCT